MNEKEHYRSSSGSNLNSSQTDLKSGDEGLSNTSSDNMKISENENINNNNVSLSDGNIAKAKKSSSKQKNAQTATNTSNQTFNYMNPNGNFNYNNNQQSQQQHLGMNSDLTSMDQTNNNGYSIQNILSFAAQQYAAVNGGNQNPVGLTSQSNNNTTGSYPLKRKSQYIQSTTGTTNWPNPQSVQGIKKNDEFSPDSQGKNLLTAIIH